MANEAIMVFLMSCHTVKAKINAWNLSIWENISITVSTVSLKVQTNVLCYCKLFLWFITLHFKYMKLKVYQTILQNVFANLTLTCLMQNTI